MRPLVPGPTGHDIVNGLLVRNGSVLLTLRAPHRKLYPSLWSFPGGHVERDETLDAALVRELREEIGVTPANFTSIGLIQDPNTAANDRVTYHMYAVTAWDGGTPRLVGDEHTELRWYAIGDAGIVRGLALEEYRTLFNLLPRG
jgi:8-oxo-dGTP diphosphatase